MTRGERAIPDAGETPDVSLVPPERRRSAVLTVLGAALLAAVVGYVRIGTVGGAIGFAAVTAVGVGVGLLAFELVQRVT